MTPTPIIPLTAETRVTHWRRPWSHCAYVVVEADGLVRLRVFGLKRP